jgi:hypothetical protein
MHLYTLSFLLVTARFAFYPTLDHVHANLTTVEMHQYTLHCSFFYVTARFAFYPTLDQLDEDSELETTLYALTIVDAVIDAIFYLDAYCCATSLGYFMKSNNTLVTRRRFVGGATALVTFIVVVVVCVALCGVVCEIQQYAGDS